MRCIAALLISLVVATSCTVALSQETAPRLRFRAQEIDKSLQVGYAVLPADLNGDGKKDIVVVDTRRVVWFENPSWQMRTITEGQTSPDNVCIDAYDVDGDGLLDLALGADWRPFNTKDGGTLQWLKRGKTLDEPWTVHAIDTEPTVHRLRFVDLDADGRAELVVGPLMGRNATQAANWGDHPLRVLAYTIPKDPVKERWTPTVLDQSLHVMHNFQPVDVDGDGKLDVLAASYEGVSWLRRGEKNMWTRTHLGDGNQANPKGNRGASEIKLGKLKNGQRFIVTIEPWHGHQVVVYVPSGSQFADKWQRHVIDEQLKWGHAISCVDLDGDGDEEIVIGIRDHLNDQVRCGVNVYRAADKSAMKWEKQVVDAGGVAVEDLAVADFNGDGRPDVVAVGRATKNVKIYWNLP